MISLKEYAEISKIIRETATDINKILEDKKEELNKFKLDISNPDNKKLILEIINKFYL